jgi:general stress protein YciG
MGIAPIDLQTLFTQVDKVGKAYASQREGQSLQQAVQGIQIQKKMEEQIQQVNEAQDTGEGAEKIKDREQRHEKRQNGGKKNSGGLNEEDSEEVVSVLRDPSLGRNIDISL